MISRSRDFKTAGGLHGDAREPVSADSDTRGDTEKHEGPPGSVGVGQELAQVDPVERALADALTLAAQAGRFDTVEVLSRELAARRLTRTAPAVASLETERAKRRSQHFSLDERPLGCY